MADVKKAAVAAKPVAKAVAATKAVETKEEKEVKEVKAEAKKETAKKAPAKKAPAKKAATTAKKEPVKKAPAKKAEVKASISVQFSGKEYKTEDFVKIAKDVWQYDLGKKVADFKTVDLYVKPEENAVYYVINGEVTGNFAI